MRRLLDLSPDAVASALTECGLKRAWCAWNRGSQTVQASHDVLRDVAEALSGDTRDHDRHEALFLAVGPESGALFGVFVHRVDRGQAQGGLRQWPYERFGDFLSDGLRLSRGMSRKNALAGLWWGGGKGLIARPGSAKSCDPEWRRLVYGEYGDFVTSLRGIYVTAEDVGTSSGDIAEVFRHTRFATGIPPERGGSGGPSRSTALGVVCAMEAALDVLELGGLEGKRVAMQGTGNVGSAMIEILLERGVARIIASEISAERRETILDRFDDGDRLDVRRAEPDDASILAEPCDVLAPNALGAVLGPETVAKVQAKIVCGSANNPLVDDEREATALTERGVVYVPDYVANRMGIVQCANEQYGSVTDDPAFAAHVSRDHPVSIYRTTRRILEEARRQGVSTVAVANALADPRALEPHPIFGLRGRGIVRSLLEGGWANP